jgi:S-adenosylmethionine:tRNA ribosyltransferase-isomerase
LSESRGSAPDLDDPSVFEFALPAGLIAQHPAQPRDSARLLDIAAGLGDHLVSDLPDLLQPGDLLVANDTRVIPAQLSGRRGEARIGITLNRPRADGTWHVLARNTRRLHPGDTIEIDNAAGFTATVLDLHDDGSATLRFNRDGAAFTQALQQAGALALPPYIARPRGPSSQDTTDYQTIFAEHDGAVAAPTAGLHFTERLLQRLAARGIGRVTLTLHVGAGTFLPVRAESVAAHTLHAERGILTADTADRINETRARGGRIVAVGTTSLRLLESACDARGTVHPFDGETEIFILPGDPIRSADLLLTNFHLPRSTLFMLVCAFAGTETMKRAYAHAIDAKYRFYSYGDATLLHRNAG